jgi:hypothetical protein
VVAAVRVLFFPLELVDSQPYPGQISAYALQQMTSWQKMTSLHQPEALPSSACQQSWILSEEEVVIWGAVKCQNQAVGG